MIGIYTRVSTTGQDLASQEAELKAWAANQQNVTWFRDKATGTKMSRPGMDRLLDEIRKGTIKKLVVWRLDRLGRTAKGLLELFDELKVVGCGFLSLRDAIDLSTPSGRLLVTVLAGVAQFETEVRTERQMAGIAVVRAKNHGKCTWGGRAKGDRYKVTTEKEKAIKELKAIKTPVAEISRITGLSRPTIYSVLNAV